MGLVKAEALEWFFSQDLPHHGRYDMPVVVAQEVDLDDLALVRFSSVGLSGEDAEASRLTVHFFEEDRDFDQVWNRPDEYLERLARHKQVLSPDFSLFTDRPVVEQIMNTFRNRWCGAYWQRAGLTVIPTVSWSDGRSFDFCFDGVEEGATVAVATLGARDLEVPFMRGYRNMMRAIEPAAVVCYGRPFAVMMDLGPVVEVPYVPNARVSERLPGDPSGR